MKKFKIILIFAISQLALLSRLEAQESSFRFNGPEDIRSNMHVFTGAKIFTSGQWKDSLVLLIREGKIEQLGKNISIPSQAIVHDLKGKYIYPSFIEFISDYGIGAKGKKESKDGPQMESGIKGAFGWNEAICSEFDAVSTFKREDKKAEELRKNGFGLALVHRRDGIARGTAALVKTGSERENLMVETGRAAAVFSFSKGSSSQDYPSSLMGSIALLRQTTLDANWYAQGRQTEFNLSLDAWNKNLSLPLLFDAGGDWQQALRADKIADEWEKVFIINGSGKEYQRIREIAASGATFVIPLNFPNAFDLESPGAQQLLNWDDMKHWEMAPFNPRIIHEAGVPFVLSAAGFEKPDDFWKNLRKAIACGLPDHAAIKALSETPARLLRADANCGSLSTGKGAHFFIATGPLTDENFQITEHWINGRPYTINPDPLSDIRGKYLLSWAELQAKLVMSGSLRKPEAKIVFSDSSESRPMLSQSLDQISLVFAVPGKSDSLRVRLSGLFNPSDKSMSGKGFDEKGRWISWSARFSEAITDSLKAEKKETPPIPVGLRFPFHAYGFEQMPAAEDLLIRNAQVWSCGPQGILQNADVWISAGKIKAVGKGLQVSTTTKVLDGTGLHISPGIIDEHSHIAIQGGVNEGTESSSAEVRIGDVLRSDDINIYRQLAGGVTSCQLLHGSANPIGGQSALVKLRWGMLPEQLKIKSADGFIKFALGENVKQSNWGENYTIRYPQTRMGVEQTYMDYFSRAKAYGEKMETYMSSRSAGKKAVIPGPMPRRDLELDALYEILKKKRFITCHSYVQSEINMLMHVADSFGFKVNTFTHILEGYKVADKMKAHGVNASTFSDWWAYKFEVNDAIPHNASVLHRMGICTAINSDDAEMARRLNQEAAKTVKYGATSEEDALKMVSIYPARMLHLDRFTGSIEAEKDADLVLWSGHPLSVYSRPLATWVDGIRYFDAERDQQMREKAAEEKNRLAQLMLAEKKAGESVKKPVKKDPQLYNCSLFERGLAH